MIYRVEVTNNMIPGMQLSHQFETVVNSEEEATIFGEEASAFVSSFNQGFIEATDDE